MYKHHYNKNTNDINTVINFTDKYAINSSIFNDYDKLNSMFGRGKPSNGTRTQTTADKREKNNKQVKGITVNSNSNVMRFNVNYAILKYLIDEKEVETYTSCNGEKQQLNCNYMTSLIGAFNNELNKTKGSLGLEFQTYKIKFCETIQKNASCVKELKLNPDKIYEKLVNKNYKKADTNDYNFDIDVFFSILKTFNINCIYLSYKCAYCMNSDFSDKYYVILNNSTGTLKQNGFMKSFVSTDDSINNDAYALIKLSKGEYNSIHENVLKYTYVITDLRKPIKSASGYKVSELQEIASKLGIIINKSNGKTKTKQELYDEVNNKLSASI